MSDVALAGKTLAEKVGLARLGPIRSFQKRLVICSRSLHILWHVSCVSSGQEVKKELTNLGSLKLDLPDNSNRFKDGLRTVEKHVVTLTGFFGRRSHLLKIGACPGIKTDLCMILLGLRQSRMKQLSTSCALALGNRPGS